MKLEYHKLIEHIEAQLGSIQHGWPTPNDSRYKYSVAVFDNSPVSGYKTFSSIGMSNHELKMSNGRSVKMELLFCIDTGSIDDKDISSFLMRMVDMVLSRHEALLRGVVIGPGKKIFNISEMNAVYVSNPVIYSEELSVFQSTPPTIFAWLLPIYQNEAKFIKENGWEQFETILEEKNPDLCGLKRPAVI